MIPSLRHLRLMKIVLLPAALLLLLSSCCSHKKDCYRPTNVDISFSGFKIEEVDTIWVTGYKKGSGFSEITHPKVRDSVYEAVTGDPSILIHDTYNSGRLTPDTDWELIIPGANATYRISDYSFEMKSCNCAFDREKTLIGCRINGKDSHVFPTRIYK